MKLRDKNFLVFQCLSLILLMCGMNFFSSAQEHLGTKKAVSHNGVEIVSYGKVAPANVSLAGLDAKRINTYRGDKNRVRIQTRNGAVLELHSRSEMLLGKSIANARIILNADDENPISYLNLLADDIIIDVTDPANRKPGISELEHRIKESMGAEDKSEVIEEELKKISVEKNVKKE